MAEPATPARSFYRPSVFNPISSFVLCAILTLLRPSEAQIAQPASQSLPQDSPIPSTDLVLPANPTDGDAIAASPSLTSSSSSIPSHTDNANYASQNPNGPQDAHVLNYYFLLLAIFVIIIALVCWSLARRRHRRLVTLRGVQQNALAQDLRTWPTAGGDGGRWTFGTGDVRREEGLNERGEAPPPYLKEPDRAHHESGAQGLELNNMSRAEGKPPGYDEWPTRR